QSYSGNIFNVSASGASSSTGTLANLQSNQLSGQILNVDATALTTGKALKVTLGTAGTAFFVNTGAYTGTLVDLQVNSVSKFNIDQAGNVTIGGTLTVPSTLTLGNGTVTGTLLNAFTNTGGTDTAFKLNHNVTGFVAATDLLLDVQDNSVSKFTVRA